MLLTVITFFPLVIGALLFFIPNDKMARVVALVATLIEFVLSLLIFNHFDASSAQMQLVEKQSWIPAFGINYFLGIDGISLWLVILTTILTPITILGSWTSIDQKVKGFLACMLILETAMIGTFLSLDAVLFYSFWELMLIPMYLLVGVWGGERRIYASVKFFIYTMLGSVFMLVAIIALMYYAKEQTGVISASFLDFYKLKLPFNAETFFNPQTLMFFAFALAFTIKAPMFPFHTWLPDAHVQAPTAGSVILAGVLLKMGTYGFLRFAIPLFPDASAQYAWLFIALAVFGIIYGALVAMVQPDMKKLVAYSSVSHLGYVVLGLFAFNTEGVTGGLYQMLNHGVSTGGLFLLVGMIYERTHSREISKYGGLAKALPIFSIIFFIITLSSIAVPGTNGFIGEFLILLGAFKENKLAAALALTGVVWGAVYMLWLYKRIFFGPAGELVPEVVDDHGHGHGHGHGGESHAQADHKKHPLFDLNVREIAVMLPLLVLVFWMGLFPNHFLDKSKASIEFFVNNRTQYHLTVYDEKPSQEKVVADSATTSKEF
ncbi:MAG: NADH-quinone oxidoreductase subunit M [Oligoflexia bacterium]|nr:NADH-quinone oxidoreductase subunit M [Oligoflexia bacterium]